MKKFSTTPINISHSLLVGSLVFLIPLTLHADVLCYRPPSKRDPKGNTVQLYKEGCPKGFTAISVEKLGVEPLFIRGADGPQGIKGASGPTGMTGPKGEEGPPGVSGAFGATGPRGLAGAPGVVGEKGARGPTGERGFQGSLGPQGAPGAKGSAGAKGEVGDGGGAGVSASDLFYFTGSSGATLMGSQGDRQLYPFNQSGGPTTPFVDVGDLMVPIGSGCSAIAFVVVLDTAPGFGNSWSFSVVQGSYNSPPTEIPLCSMTAAARSCNYSAVIPTPLPAETSIVLLANKVGTSPPSTRARWSLKCTAP